MVGSTWWSSVVGVTFFIAASAWAQTPTTPLGGEPPTLGVRLPAASLVGNAEGDATSIDVNPAALARLKSWSFVYHHSEMPDQGRYAGRGDAWFLGTRLPLFSSWRAGLGVQWLRPSEPIGYADGVKLSLTAAWEVAQWMALGVSYHAFFSSDDPALDDLDTVDVGLTLTPFQWASLGFVVRDLTGSDYQGLSLERRYQVALGFPTLAQPVCSSWKLASQSGKGEAMWTHGFASRETSSEGCAYLAMLRWFDATSIVKGSEAPMCGAHSEFPVDLERIGFAFSTFLGRSMPAGTNVFTDGETQSAWQGWGVTFRAYGDPREPIAALSQRIVEIEFKDNLNQRKMIALVDLFERIERRSDVSAILLRVDQLGTGWAEAQELRNWVTRLRAAGKKVFAYLYVAGEREYYLASAADRIYLDPAGGVDLTGIQIRLIYLKGLLDMLGINPQVVKRAEYKSAPEMFTNSEPSEPAREMYRALVDNLYDQVMGDISTDRRVAVEALQATVDKGPFNPDRAVDEKLVDELVEPEDLRKKLQEDVKARWASPSVLRRADPRWPLGPAIAVVVLEGDIVRGKSMTIPLLSRRVVGDETIGEALKRAQQSSRIKAIVLRINSPGGSAVASDHMWRAVREAAKVKPVIVSLANIAASGGYYAAVGGAKILAQPATITGSIGVFSGKLDVSGMLEKVGIKTTRISRGKHAGVDGFDRPYTDEERAVIEAQVDYYYQRFLRVVAEGRPLEQEEVEQVAKGRVWSGAQAYENKLVDQFGGLIDAITLAKKRAGYRDTDRLELVVLPEERKTLLQRAVDLVLPSNKQPLTPAMTRDLVRHVPPVLFYTRSGDPLTRLPVELVTRP